MNTKEKSWINFDDAATDVKGSFMLDNIGAYKTYKVGLQGKWLYHNSKETSNTDSEKQEVLFHAVQALGLLPQY